MKKFLLIVVLAGLAACKTKSSLTHPTPGPGNLVGQWNWVQSDVWFNYYTGQSGVKKTLTFTGSGAVYISHNDSIGDSTPLVYTTRLVTPVIDTMAYSFGPAPVGGGFPGTFSAVFFGRYPYQYWFSGDTLVIAAAPALPQPNEAKYLRSDINAQ